MKFAVVGSVGALVNLAVLYGLVQFLGVWFMGAEVVAIGVSFSTNYFGNILIGNIRVTTQKNGHTRLEATGREALLSPAEAVDSPRLASE
jgi:hypothetical protein